MESKQPSATAREGPKETGWCTGRPAGNRLRRFELEGSPRELGLRHGRLLGAEIREMRRAVLAYLARLSLGVGAFPLYGALVWLARRFWPRIPPRLQEEMAAVARGAALGLGSVLLINVADDLANNSPRCSALAVGDGLTADGAYLMGRNLDYPIFLDVLVRLQTLFFLKPDGGQHLASLAWPGYVGVCTGINRAGVALAQLSAMSLDRTMNGVPAAMRFRQALQGAATMPEVAAGVLEAPGTIGNNLLLCSEHEALVVEMSACRGVQRFPREGLLSATNHYQSDAMRDLKGRFPPRPPFSPLSSYHFSEGYSRARNERLQELARGRTLGVVDLQSILADEKVANAGTASCTIFAPGARRLWVARGLTTPVNRGPFEEIMLWG